MIFKIKVKTKNGNDIDNKKSLTIVLSSRYKKTKTGKKGYYTFHLVGDSSFNIERKIYSIKDSHKLLSSIDVFAKGLYNIINYYEKHLKNNNLKPDSITVCHRLEEMKKL